MICLAFGIGRNCNDLWLYNCIPYESVSTFGYSSVICYRPCHWISFAQVLYVRITKRIRNAAVRQEKTNSDVEFRRGLGQQTSEWLNSSR